MNDDVNDDWSDTWEMTAHLRPRYQEVGERVVEATGLALSSSRQPRLGMEILFAGTGLENLTITKQTARSATRTALDSIVKCSMELAAALEKDRVAASLISSRIGDLEDDRFSRVDLPRGTAFDYFLVGGIPLLAKAATLALEEYPAEDLQLSTIWDDAVSGKRWHRTDPGNPMEIIIGVRLRDVFEKYFAGETAGRPLIKFVKVALREANILKPDGTEYSEGYIRDALYMRGSRDRSK